MAADILKQNQGNKILRQNQGGKILKANYNFGKAFKPSSSIYIQTLPYNFTAQPSVEAWVNQIGSPGHVGYFRMVYSTGQVYGFGAFNLEPRAGMIGGPIALRNDNASTQFVHLVLRSNSTVLKRWMGNNKQSVSGIGADTMPGLVNVMQIGRGINSTSNDNLSTVRPIALVRIYDRTLADAEIAFQYNLGLGNDSLYTTSLTHEFKMQKAEILDFSAAQDGSDMRVGVKNYGSTVNGHGEIIGLPAGTLEEKAAWANANLFVNFL